MSFDITLTWKTIVIGLLVLNVVCGFLAHTKHVIDLKRILKSKTNENGNIIITEGDVGYDGVNSKRVLSISEIRNIDCNLIKLFFLRIFMYLPGKILLLIFNVVIFVVECVECIATHKYSAGISVKSLAREIFAIYDPCYLDICGMSKESLCDRKK